MIVPLFKTGGITPLQALEQLRVARPELAEEPMVYAGRLDPMAEGLLLVLTGEDRFALPAHLSHDKEYVASMLFGVSSDTFDGLGRISLGSTAPLNVLPRGGWEAFVGTHRLPLPAYSAFRVRGRALHSWAAEGRLPEVELPVRDMIVRSASEVQRELVRVSNLLSSLETRIGSVRGAFRQDAALSDWRAIAGTNPELLLVSVRLTVNSGTYVRALTQELGEQLGCGALLYRLVRTRVGPYSLPPEAPL